MRWSPQASSGHEHALTTARRTSVPPSAAEVRGPNDIGRSVAAPAISRARCCARRYLVAIVGLMASPLLTNLGAALAKLASDRVAGRQALIELWDTLDRSNHA